MVDGGGNRSRTDHLLHAKQTLFQLSYTPKEALSDKSLKGKVVEVNGIEPLTLCLQSRCSPS